MKSNSRGNWWYVLVLIHIVLVRLLCEVVFLCWVWSFTMHCLAFAFQGLSRILTWFSCRMSEWIIVWHWANPIISEVETNECTMFADILQLSEFVLILIVDCCVIENYDNRSFVMRIAGSGNWRDVNFECNHYCTVMTNASNLADFAQPQIIDA